MLHTKTPRKTGAFFCVRRRAPDVNSIQSLRFWHLLRRHYFAPGLKDGGRTGLRGSLRLRRRGLDRYRLLGRLGGRVRPRRLFFTAEGAGWVLQPDPRPAARGRGGRGG